MDYKVINLKNDLPSVEQALAMLEIFLDECKLDGTKVVKVIHGYGSHGVGGAICYGVRVLVRNLKKNKKIKDFLLGNEWDMSNQKCLDILTKLKDCYNDEDIGKMNPGITIIVL